MPSISNTRKRKPDELRLLQVRLTHRDVDFLKGLAAQRGLTLKDLMVSIVSDLRMESQ